MSFAVKDRKSDIVTWPKTVRTVSGTLDQNSLCPGQSHAFACPAFTSSRTNGQPIRHTVIAVGWERMDCSHAYTNGAKRSRVSKR